jgi:hypothetical protein
VGDRLAGFVDDAARDHGTWREREVDVLEASWLRQIYGPNEAAEARLA